MLQVPRIGVFVLSCCAALLGCQGAIDGSSSRRPGVPGAPSVDANGNPIPPVVIGPDGKPVAVSAPGAVVMRRLTVAEYDNTLRDVARVTQSLSSSFPREETDRGFNNNGAALTFPPALGDSALTAAQSAGRAVVANLAQHVTCATPQTPACATQFIREFGQKAWRRPLTDEEVTRLQGVFDVGNTQVGFDLGIELVATSMFISAPFWFRIEKGDGQVVAAPAPANSVRPTSWEMASRLSYFLWNSAPSPQLYGLAAQDGLKTAEAVKAQALAMLSDANDPRTRQAVANFDAQWLQLDRMNLIDKDPNRFPKWTTELRGLLRTEMEMMLAHAAWNAPAGLDDLLTTTAGYANATLAQYYGMQGPAQAPTGTAFEPIQLDAATRGGILSRAGILARDGFVQTSPTQRGAYLRRRLLCQEPAPPPPNVKIEKPVPSASETTRQQIEAHASQEPCKGCHSFIDPIGFGLESYDAIGLYRQQENNKPIDDNGEVLGMDANGAVVPGDIGTFRGAVELGQKMAQSPTVDACFAQSWFRFTNGRAPVAADAGTLKRLADLVTATGGDHRQLIIELTQTDAFLYRSASGS